MSDMRVVIVPDLSVGSREWWIGEAQVCELVGLGGREIRLRVTTLKDHTVKPDDTMYVETTARTVGG